MRKDEIEQALCAKGYSYDHDANLFSHRSQFHGIKSFIDIKENGYLSFEGMTVNCRVKHFSTGVKPLVKAIYEEYEYAKAAKRAINVAICDGKAGNDAKAKASGE